MTYLDFEKPIEDLEKELVKLREVAVKSKVDVSSSISELEEKIKSIVQTTNQLKNLESQLAEIRARETLSPEKYNELLKQVNDLKSKSSIDPEYINKIQSVIKSLETKQGAGDELFNKVMGQLHNTQVSLDAKEKRFEKYIQKKTGEIAGLKAQSAEELTKTAKDSAEEIKKYKDIVQGYKGDIDQFGSTMQKLKTEANKDIEEILRYNELMGSYKQEVDKFGDTIKNAKSVANYRINKLLAAGENRINTEVGIIQDLRGELQQNLEQVQGDMATVKGDMATVKGQMATVKGQMATVKGQIAKVKGYTDEIEKMINFIKGSSGYVAHQALNKAQDTSSAAVKAGQQNTDQQSTGSQSTGSQSTGQKNRDKPPPSCVGTQNMTENQIYLFDDVKLTRQHPDPYFNEWLQKHIEYLVKIFKRNYKNDLARKNPTYGDQQIADAIEDNAEWLNNWFKKHDDAPLTNEVVDIFLSGVKVYLWAEPVDTDYLQGQLFNSKVYENILDRMISETLNKER